MGCWGIGGQWGKVAEDETVRGRRQNVFVATKVRNFARRAGHPLNFLTPEHVYLCCDASLGRMGIDTDDTENPPPVGIDTIAGFVDPWTRDGTQSVRPFLSC